MQAMNSKMRRRGSDAAASVLNAYVTTGKVRSNYVTNDVAAKDVQNNQLNAATTPPSWPSNYFNFGQHDVSFHTRRLYEYLR
jgi:hypothetical protein